MVFEFKEDIRKGIGEKHRKHGWMQAYLSPCTCVITPHFMNSRCVLECKDMHTYITGNNLIPEEVGHSLHDVHVMQSP